MGHRGSFVKNGARTLGSDLELSQGPLPATGTNAVPQKPSCLPWRQSPILLPPVTGSSCVLCPEVLKLILCFTCRLDRQDGERVKSQPKVGHCLDKTGVFFTGDMCTTEPQKELGSWSSLCSYMLPA